MLEGVRGVVGAGVVVGSGLLGEVRLFGDAELVREMGEAGSLDDAGVDDRVESARAVVHDIVGEEVVLGHVDDNVGDTCGVCGRSVRACRVAHAFSSSL